jgi:hypothetical protein
MPDSIAAQNIRTALTLLGLVGLLGLGCKSLPGAKMNMFEGTNALDGAAKIKAKLGVNNVKVHRMSIREDKMEIVVQDPNKPKNFDEYIYEKGAVSGPKPVEALVLGNQEFTADKSRLFDLDEANLGAVADVCGKAVERAKVEEGKCEIISINWESARWTRSKEENDKKYAEAKEEKLRKARTGKLDFNEQLRKDFSDLAVTWRVWIKGPRATKDFWVDLKGNVWDYQ